MLVCGWVWVWWPLTLTNKQLGCVEPGVWLHRRPDIRSGSTNQPSKYDIDIPKQVYFGFFDISEKDEKNY